MCSTNTLTTATVGGSCGELKLLSQSLADQNYGLRLKGTPLGQLCKAQVSLC